jgi:hypothetical protein
MKFYVKEGEKQKYFATKKYDDHFYVVLTRLRRVRQKVTGESREQNIRRTVETVRNLTNRTKCQS